MLSQRATRGFGEESRESWENDCGFSHKSGCSVGLQSKGGKQGDL